MNRNGLLIWVLAGAGILFLYAAIKNVTPQSVITAQLGNGARVAINPTATLAPTTVVLNSATGQPTGTTVTATEAGGITAPRGYASAPNNFIPKSRMRIV